MDCPGHASLIRTIIGGAQIIDLMMLVIDVTKGVQTQTAECLVVGEILMEDMLLVLNKTDLVPSSASLLLSSLELSDTQVYEPYTRALVPSTRNPKCATLR